MTNLIPSHHRVMLAQAVNEGFRGTLPFTVHVHQNYPRCDEIFCWLIKNKITGNKLYQWLKAEHEGSQLKAISYILQKIDKEKEPHKIIYGRDFV